MICTEKRERKCEKKREKTYRQTDRAIHWSFKINLYSSPRKTYVVSHIDECFIDECIKIVEPRWMTLTKKCSHFEGQIKLVKMLKLFVGFFNLSFFIFTRYNDMNAIKHSTEN